MDNMNVYIGDKPIAVAQSCKIEYPAMAEAKKFYSDYERIKNGFSFECDVEVENPSALWGILHNFLIEQWQACHRGNVHNYFACWKENKTYLLINYEFH